jgi:ankyrin repeat protein
VAVEIGDIDAARKALDAGADVNAIDYDIGYHGGTPLILATMSGRRDIAKLLLDRKADIDRTNSDGDTALHEAVLSRNTDFVEFLLDNGANTGISNKEGKTALMLAQEQSRDGTGEPAAARVTMLRDAEAKQRK